MTTPKHYSYTEIMDELTNPLYADFASNSMNIKLLPGDTAWNPVSVKHLLHGPATVRYVRYKDGGIRAIFDVRSDSTIEADAGWASAAEGGVSKR